MRYEDAVWLKNAADGLARCVGTYRAAAEVMRVGGREQSAAYVESVATGALLAAYLLLDSRATLKNEPLSAHAASVYLEGVADAASGEFAALAPANEAMSLSLRGCVALSGLQSSVLKSLSAPTTAPTS